jgi:V8-like Glu-specific endopeptidase
VKIKIADSITIIDTDDSDAIGSTVNTIKYVSHDEYKEQFMAGIPQALLLSTKQALKECDEFLVPGQVAAVMISDDLMPFRGGLPYAPNLDALVDLTISYLYGKYRSNGENALVLFLEALSSRYDEADQRNPRLKVLASQIQWVLQCPKAIPNQRTLQANPAAAHMLWINDVEKMLSCARAVARAEIRRFRNGNPAEESKGTAWLVAPSLALTCWHVIEALTKTEQNYGTQLSADDMQLQVANCVLTFDYTAFGNGIQYKVDALESSQLRSHPLDYALLRLKDRTDWPLSARGYLRLDPEEPLTAQSILYIIQHPLGQLQQVAGDCFVRAIDNSERILYKTPTEPGTSGAPVFNRVNWKVVAIHNAENDREQLREGTTIKAILENIRRTNLTIHREILEAQQS